MKKFITISITIITILTWNHAAFGCEAYDAETMQHTTNYSSTSIIEWEETAMEEPVVEEVVVESTTENPTVEEEPTIEENPIVEEEHVIEEPTTEEPTATSAKAEIKAKAEEEIEEIAPVGVSEKHFVQTGLLEDYRALEDKVIYLITALLISLLLYMPFNRKKAEARKERRNKNVKVK